MASLPPSPTYNDAIQRGRNELKLLRESPDKIRNIKDLKYEEERRLEEEQEKKQLEARRVEEAKERELEKQRSGRENKLETKDDFYGNSVSVSALGVFGAVAGCLGIAASMIGKESTGEVVEDNKFGGYDSTEELMLNPASVLSGSKIASVDSVVADKLQSGISDIVLSYDDAETLVGEDKIEVMERLQNEVDYDWGDAWLGTISEIMNDMDDESN